MKRGEQENLPKGMGQQSVLPKAAAAEQKLDARMEIPTLWECLEVFRWQKEVAQEK